VTARRYAIFAVAAALTLALDQLTKIWARAALKPIYPQVKTVIRGYWEFRYSENPAAAFGLFRWLPGAVWIFPVVAVAMTVGIIYHLRNQPPRHPLRVTLEFGLVVGGALGNAIDRLLFGHVTDFIVWKIGTHEWDTFNVADAALVVGILGLLLHTGKPKRKVPAPA
jgi:signal peptidase II